MVALRFTSGGFGQGCSRNPSDRNVRPVNKQKIICEKIYKIKIMNKIIALLNRDDKKKKLYYEWKPIDGLELEEVPHIGEIIEFGNKMYIVDSLSFDFEKKVNKVVFKVFQQPSKN